MARPKVSKVLHSQYKDQQQKRSNVLGHRLPQRRPILLLGQNAQEKKLLHTLFHIVTIKIKCTRAPTSSEEAHPIATQKFSKKEIIHIVTIKIKCTRAPTSSEKADPAGGRQNILKT